jgi:HAD superfamily hydrolase (TIGR01484 family)
MIRLVGLDFDLTIYDYANPSKTAELIPWFKALDALGIAAGIVSGRDYDDLKKTLEETGVVWAGPFPNFIICKEGHIVQSDGSEVKAARGWNSWRMEVTEKCNNKLKPIFEIEIKKAVGSGLVCIDDLTLTDAGIKVVFETPQMAEIVRKSLVAAISHLPEYRITRNHHIILGQPTGADKGGALAAYTKISGLKEQEVLAVGDNMNDLSMIAGPYDFNVATVANADESVLNAVIAKKGYIASKKCSSGVAQIFEHYFGNSCQNKKPTVPAVAMINSKQFKTDRKVLIKEGNQ